MLGLLPDTLHLFRYNWTAHSLSRSITLANIWRLWQEAIPFCSSLFHRRSALGADGSSLSIARSSPPAWQMATTPFVLNMSPSRKAVDFSSQADVYSGCESFLGSFLQQAPHQLVASVMWTNWYYKKYTSWHTSDCKLTTPSLFSLFSASSSSGALASIVHHEDACTIQLLGMPHTLVLPSSSIANTLLALLVTCLVRQYTPHCLAVPWTCSVHEGYHQ